jgi:phage FluMu protein Com
MSENLPEVRCPHCNKLFFRGLVWVVEVKCPRCKEKVNLQVLNLRDRIKQAKQKQTKNGGK